MLYLSICNKLYMMTIANEPVNEHVRGLAVACGCGVKWFPFRCPAKSERKCEWCKLSRSRMFLAKFHERMRIAQIDFKDCFMWTLGTDIMYVREYDWDQGRYVDNLNEITVLWQKFNSQMKIKRKRYGLSWDPLVYVVEAGSHGGRLHIHLLQKGGLPHKTVLEVWRSITDLQANVNFVPSNSAGYLAKYTGKGYLRYSFLGRLYSARPGPKEKRCLGCGSAHVLISSDAYRYDYEDKVN